MISDLEKGQLIDLYREGVSMRQAFEDVNRSNSAVRYFLRFGREKKGSTWGMNIKKVTKKDTRRLIRTALRSKLSVYELRYTLDFSVGVRRIQQLLQEVPYLKYKKVFMAPLMTFVHKAKRLEWARRNVSRGDYYWAKVTFWDENI